MREQHGSDASIVAAMRVDAMLEANDHAGYAVWARIFAYIAKLGPIIEAGTTRH